MRFHCIRSVLGIIIMLKNKTVPNQALSRRNGMINKTSLCLSALMIPSISATPRAEMQPQTGTDPPPCFTEGPEHPFFHLSATLLLTYWQLDWTQKCQTCIRHSIKHIHVYISHSQALYTICMVHIHGSSLTEIMTCSS